MVKIEDVESISQTDNTDEVDIDLYLGAMRLVQEQKRSKPNGTLLNAKVEATLTDVAQTLRLFSFERNVSAEEDLLLRLNVLLSTAQQGTSVSENQEHQ